MEISDILDSNLDGIDKYIETSLELFINLHVVPTLDKYNTWMDGSFTLYTHDVNVVLEFINFYGMNTNKLSYDFREDHVELSLSYHQKGGQLDKYNFVEKLLEIENRYPNFQLDSDLTFGEKNQTIQNVKDWNFFKSIIESQITTWGDIGWFEYTVGEGLQKITTDKDYQKMLDIVHAQENKFKNSSD